VGSHPTVIVPCETRNRELDAKLLLGCAAAERGFPVVVGEKKAINLRLGGLPRGLYLSKSLTNRNVRIYDVLRQLGHRVVCGDEEGLVYHSREQYWTTKVGAEAFARADALLAWGEENAANWRAHPAYAGAPIFVTGNPRIDLLRPELRGLFDEEAEKLRHRFGRFVLVNTNFSRVNHWFPAQSHLRTTLARAEREPGAVPEDELGVARQKQLLFEHFLAMVERLESAFPDVAVVVRPHPSESHAPWLRVAEGRPRLCVVHEGPVVPWLVAAEAVIHNGCTSAIETWLLGRTPIAYRPVRSDRFDLDLPNDLSEQGGDAHELVALVAAALEGRLQPAPEAVRARRGEIARHVAALEGDLAADRIVGALEEVAAGAVPARAPRARDVLVGRARLAVRGVRKRVEARLPEHRNSRAYVRHVFPPTSLAEVQARIDALGRRLGRFDAVRAVSRADNVFELRTR